MHGDGHARLRECREPRRRLRRAVEPRQRDQRHVVGIGICRVGFERLAALDAGLASGNPQVDELAAGEEPEIGVGADEGVPLEAGLDDDDVALFATVLPRGGAYRVARLQRRQRLVAVDNVKRRETTGEMDGEIVRTDLHV